MRLLVVAAAAAVLLLPSVASAAPTYAGNVDREFDWSGGPLTGANIVGEPCGPTRQCEDVLLKLPIDGTATVTWTAKSPINQGWLGAQVFHSAPGGVPTGTVVKESSGLSNTGSITWDAGAGDYILEMSSLLSVTATYDAKATLVPEDNGPLAPVAPTPLPPAVTATLPSATAVNGFVDKKGKLGVRLGCTAAGGCAGKLAVTVKKKVVAHRAYRIKAQATKAYLLKLDGATAKRVRKGAKLKAALTLTGADSHVLTKRFTLHR